VKRRGKRKREEGEGKVRGNDLEEGKERMR
jgi:hypothetical protein